MLLVGTNEFIYLFIKNADAGFTFECDILQVSIEVSLEWGDYYRSFKPSCGIYISISG